MTVPSFGADPAATRPCPDPVGAITNRREGGRPGAPTLPAARCPGRSVCNPRDLAACAQAVAGAVAEQGDSGLGVLSALPHLVYWKDLQGRYTGCNEAFRSARGLAGPADLVGRTEDELPVRDAFTQTLPPIEATVIATGVPATGVQAVTSPPSTGGRPEVGDRPPDDAAGESVKVLLTVLPLRTPDGAVRGVVGVGADVTGLSDLDAKLSHASRMESIGRLAENIAHQINTPVQYITDNVRFVADGLAEAMNALESVNALAAQGAATGDPGLAGVRDILSGLNVDFLVDELPGAILQSLEGLSQIAQIVSALKSYSRPRGQMVPADVNHLVDNAVQLTGPQWTPVADLRLHLAPDLGQLLCYEGELRQVLLNLVANAAHAVATRQATDPGYPQGLIQISTHRDHDTIRIVVTDDGCGMDDAVRSRIFDPFFTTKDFGQATGQGLSLAHATIVTRHHGSIDVQTAPGAGTTFTITLPTTGRPVADIQAAQPPLP